MTLAAISEQQLLSFRFQIRYFLTEQTLGRRHFYSGQSDNVKKQLNSIFFFFKEQKYFIAYVAPGVCLIDHIQNICYYLVLL